MLQGMTCFPINWKQKYIRYLETYLKSVLLSEKQQPFILQILKNNKSIDQYDNVQVGNERSGNQNEIPTKKTRWKKKQINNQVLIQ